jgi:FAD-linked oxidoreductase
VKMRTLWRNWSGTQSCSPEKTVRPRDVEEIVRAVKEADRNGKRLRPRGAGHSATQVAVTDDVALDLSDWTGIQHADQATGLVTVRSGTRLSELDTIVDEYGLALANLSDIDTQTVAGAISTGTHGTGLRLGGMPTQVRRLELVLADGSVVSCSETERPELFASARTGLGAVGVISAVTLQCEPAFDLSAEEYPEPVDQVLERFTDYATENDHFEFYWFPHGRTALVKRNNRLPVGEPTRPLGKLRHWFEYDLMENAALGAVCRTARTVPALTRPLNRLCSALASKRHYSDRSHRVLTTERRVRFLECEYAVPFDSFHQVFGQLRAVVQTLPHPIIFPAEVRVAAPDDVWLSPAYQRATAYISVQQYLGMPYLDYFTAFERIVSEVGGRPHWGKWHSMEYRELRRVFPRLEDFCRVRRAVDPGGLFLNEYLDDLFEGSVAEADR